MFYDPDKEAFENIIGLGEKCIIISPFLHNILESTNLSVFVPLSNQFSVHVIDYGSKHDFPFTEIDFTGNRKHCKKRPPALLFER